MIPVNFADDADPIPSNIFGCIFISIGNLGSALTEGN